jgi:pimeloyl-ACP methyl ester carboxylesterase
MPLANLDTGIRMHYDMLGDGEDMLLIPGTGGTDQAWTFQLDLFRRSYRCVTFDLRGAGRTDKPQVGYTVRDLAEDVRSLMDHLGIDRAHAYGWSLGGAIAQELAINYPRRVRSLSLHGTWAKTDAWLRSRFEASKFLMLHAPKELSLAHKRWLLYSPSALTDGRALFLYNQRKHGDPDNSLPARYCEEVHRLIAGSTYYLFRGKGSSHSVFMERPEEFNGIQLDFLRKIT